MHKWYIRAAAAALPAAVFCGAGAEPQTQPYARETPLVRAVRKTREGVVTVYAFRRRDYGLCKEVAGTAVIVDERGYAVTNGHVVAGAERLSVRLADGAELDCTVTASEPRYDLVILRLPTDHTYHELPFRRDGDLMVGETVIAVGNPLGYTNTVTTGIISALGRDIEMDETTLKDLIQHSACINPGNSGGPLLDINGELIGINVAMRSGAQGIGFALRAETVQKVLSRRLNTAGVSKLTRGPSVREVQADDGLGRRKAANPAATGRKGGEAPLRGGGGRGDGERAVWDSAAWIESEAVVRRICAQTTDMSERRRLWRDQPGKG
jgi:serine protease Do